MEQEGSGDGLLTTGLGDPGGPGRGGKEGEDRGRGAQEGEREAEGKGVTKKTERWRERGVGGKWEGRRDRVGEREGGTEGKGAM